MVKLNLLLLGLPWASAWPAVMEMVANSNIERALKNPSGRPNTATPPAGFDEHEQFVDVRPGTEHEYRRPGPNDHRGQCPGLNAAANHGFLPRSGLTTPETTVAGLTAAYNMDATQAFILSILSIALSGDIPTMTWSIGGKFPGTLGGLLGSPHGLTGTHNSYEGDGSPVSGDAFMHGGKVGEFEMDRWEALWNIGADGYNMDNMAAHNVYTVQKSIATNPNYFAAPLPGLVVIPGAHNFVIVFMSNHTRENPGGYLDRNILKSFFGVSGDKPGEFKFDYGSQQIPQNWYKMPFLNSYTIVQTVGDAFVNGALYPGAQRLGGNTNGPNTFTGLDASDISGGVFHAGNLAQGNNALCFALQATMAGRADEADILGFLESKLTEPMANFGCPTFNKKMFNFSSLSKFPGAKYQAPGGNEYQK